MSLYRKYRPQTFDAVTGQEPVVTTLRNAVAQDKIAHAYLFAGPRGTGKTSIARILAKTLLTHAIQDETIKKQIIKAVEEGSMVDLIEIDAASNRGIDDIRELIEKIQFSPIVASAKVYIIDEVHMLTREAFNALLKTLEEPPSYAYFILATTELQKIPPTIQSRCQRFTFRQIDDDAMVARLEYIAGEEHMQVEKAALEAIAHHAQGGLRDAISLLDQLRSLEKVTLSDVQARLGGISIESLEGLLQATTTGDREQVIRLVRELEESGAPMDAVVRQMLGKIRADMHGRISRNETIDDLTQLLNALLDAVRNIRLSPVPALALETALLSYSPATGAMQAPSVAPPLGSSPPRPSPATPSPSSSTPKQEDPKQSAASVSVASSSPSAASVSSIAATPPASSNSSGSLSLMDVVSAWPDLANKVTPAAVKMSLKNGRVTAVEDGSVTLTFTAAFHRDRVAQTDSSTAIERLMQETFQRPLRLRCLVDQNSIPPPANQPMVNLAEAAADIF